VRYQTIFLPEHLTSKVLALPWGGELIRHFAANPEEMYSLTPRTFDAFVADLLSRLYPEASIKLSPPGKDDGVDITLERPTEVRSEQLLVQCKRYNAESTASRTVLKLLHGDLNDRLATRGMVVTTSFFTKPALDYIV